MTFEASPWSESAGVERPQRVQTQVVRGLIEQQDVDGLLGLEPVLRQ